MKKKSRWLPGLLALVALAGCGSGTTPGEAAETPAGPVALQEQDTLRRQAFAQALRQVDQERTLPDGMNLAGYGGPGAGEGRFAVADVNGDRMEELVLSWDSGYMAGRMAQVYGYDGEGVYEELNVFPLPRFYDNGIVEEDFSHNQGLAGDFWPYFVYQYDGDSGVYRRIGGVDAWDRKIREKNLPGDIFPERFPDEVDEDGDGVVYFLLPGDWEGYYHDVPMVDGPAYEAWRNAYLEGATEVEFTLQRLTEDNIALLAGEESP